MFTIDSKTNNDYFLILKDGKEYVRINKRRNSLDKVKSYFQIK